MPVFVISRFDCILYFTNAQSDSLKAAVLTARYCRWNACRNKQNTVRSVLYRRCSKENEKVHGLQYFLRRGEDMNLLPKSFIFLAI